MREDPESREQEKEIEKLPEAILCSGDRDSLNVAGFGYQVLWMNSETARLSEIQYKSIMKCVETLYILPDIDTTGIRSAIRLGLQYLDIRFIWLPESLREYKDNRGKTRKDLRDYVELYPERKDFQKLINVAMPLRFWDEVTKEEGKRYYSMTNMRYFF